MKEDSVFCDGCKKVIPYYDGICLNTHESYHDCKCGCCIIKCNECMDKLRQNAGLENEDGELDFGDTEYSDD